MFALVMIGSLGLATLALPILETSLSESLAYFTLGGIEVLIGLIAIYLMRNPSTNALSFKKFMPYLVILIHFPTSLLLLWISSVRHDGVSAFSLNYIFIYWMFLLVFVVVSRLTYRVHQRRFEGA
ncbi:hypothetical protein OKS35_05210 [Exiguobacterium sp. N5]|uniref:hypothetical protein n=1 Tax=Exiguobacterium sp. N5 TaxID=2990450 RepID=UPI0021F3CE6D|nr:hypothetical protein [Exiguobacterium sp. N5]MCV9899518.1 hypothetical protein [Exiguobacterium sp. N5]